MAQDTDGQIHIGGFQSAIKRRKFLRGSGVMVVGGLSSALAGCNGETGEPGSPNLQVIEAEGEVTLTGNVVVTASVTNNGNVEGIGELWAEVNFPDGESYSESRLIQVSPDETKTYEIEISIPLTGLSNLREASLDVWID